MPYHLYLQFSSETPSRCAKIVAVVNKENYLAHAIREIENAVLQTFSKNFRIATHCSTCKDSSSIYFSENGCTIFIPKSAMDEGDPKEIRIRLAHELGHLIYNFKSLSAPAILNKRPTASAEEEAYAWAFAYTLICEKSNGYADKSYFEEFIVDEEALKQTVRRLAGLKDGVVDILEVHLKATQDL